MILLLACAQPPSDAEHYLAAAAAEDAARCASITAPTLAGECAVMIAREQGQAGRLDAARSTCAALSAGLWRDECYFMVADVADVMGDQARQACALAGQFRTQCIGHAISREVSAVLKDAQRGDELQTLRLLDEAVGRYIPGQERGGRVRQMMATHIARRDPEALFSAALCGAAPPPICQDAFVERIRNHDRAAGRADGAWRRACGAQVTVARAQSLGLPGWSPDADGIARAGWEQLCRR